MLQNKSLILGLVSIIFIFGGLLYIYNPKPTEYGLKNNTTMCTADSMLCEDGSFVGRSGPDCKFVCPTKEQNASSSEILEKNDNQ